jgi:lantibiotic modifying enzyme
MGHRAPGVHSAPLDRRRLLKSGLAASIAAAGLPSPLLAALGRIALEPTSGRPYLDVARRAERWIAASARRGPTGLAWPWNPAAPGEVQLNLYTGMPGVVLFYLELLHATGDRALLEPALSGADYLAASLPADGANADAGLYTGLAGVAYTLELAHRAGGASRHRDAAARALALIRARARPTGRGVEWSESSDMISGSAGVGLFLLWAHEALGDASSLDLAVSAGRRLVERGQPDRGGLTWTVSPQVPRNYPNFSHGTAGVSYFLATLHERTGDRAFLSAARAGAAYLDAISTKTAHGGRLVYHSAPGNEELFYLSWCHGPAGTARLYHRLASVTGERDFASRVGQLAQGIVDMRVPERSPGFWNNISQCCGNCGVSEFFVDLAAATKHTQHLEFARRVAADTIRRATDDADGSRWTQAENRVQPDNLVAQTGLMQGAAGVGLAMLHLDGAGERRRPFVVLPDNPFTQPG